MAILRTEPLVSIYWGIPGATGLARFLQVLMENSLDSAAWYSHGNTLYNLGHYDAAIAGYDRVLAVQSDLYEVWSYRGYALENLGRYQEALASFEQALKINPEYSLAWHGKGVTLAKLGRYEEALRGCLRSREEKEKALIG